MELYQRYKKTLFWEILLAEVLLIENDHHIWGLKKKSDQSYIASEFGNNTGGSPGKGIMPAYNPGSTELGNSSSPLE